jgi:hypothetical protein
MEELGTTQCYPDEPDRNTSASTNDIDAGLAFCVQVTWHSP